MLLSRLPVGSSARRTSGWVTRGAGDGGALHFATGEFAGAVFEAVGQPDQVEEAAGLGAMAAAVAEIGEDRVGDHQGSEGRFRAS